LEPRLKFAQELPNHASAEERENVLSWTTEVIISVIASGECCLGTWQVSYIIDIGKKKGFDFLAGRWDIFCLHFPSLV
jgi:hypothetical protein